MLHDGRIALKVFVFRATYEYAVYLVSHDARTRQCPQSFDVPYDVRRLIMQDTAMPSKLPCTVRRLS